jgi:hypothetical protein
MNKHSNIVRKLIPTMFLLLAVAGCGGGSGNNSDGENTDDGPSEAVSDNSDTNNETDNGVTDDATGDYDLAAYMFDASLGQVGGFVSYESHMHNIQTGNEVMAGIENSAQWEATGENTIVYRVNNSQEPSDSYVIHDSLIEKTMHDDDNRVISMPRFVSTGEAYQDEHIEDPFDYEIMPPGEEFPVLHITCQVLKHLDSFDFNTVSSQLSDDVYENYALGPFTMEMADGVYQDVLHVRCLSILDDITLNDAEIFYARGIGEVLVVDKLGIIMGGPALYIPERSGTVYYGSSQ